VASGGHLRSIRSGGHEPPVRTDATLLLVLTMDARRRREFRVGAWLVDRDGHQWRVVGVAPGTITLAGCATEQEFEVAADGRVVSDP